MKKSNMIRLLVPGTNWRFGIFISDLPFDNFIKVQIDGELINGKAKSSKEPFFYLARRKDVEFI